MKKISELEKAQFCEQLGMILDGGLSIEDGLEALSEQVEDTEYKTLLNSISESMSNGKTFYESLNETRMYDSYMIHMIQVGEESGYLDKVCNELSTYYKRMDDTKQKIKDALTYPSILIMMMLVVIIVLISNILPLFESVLSNMGVAVSSYALILLQIGRNLAIIALVVLVVIFLIAMYIFFVLKGKNDSFIVMLQKMPITKKVGYDLAVVQFSYALSLLLNSGQRQEEALAMCSNMCEIKSLKEKIDEVIKNMNEGSNLGDALLKVKIFKNIYNRMLVIGLKSGHFEKTVNEVAKAYEVDIDRNINKTLDVIEPALVALLSIIVGIILLSVMLPLASIMVNL